MGKSGSKVKKKPNGDGKVEGRQLTRKEKYDLFVSIRDDTEETVIQFFKSHPWTLSCLFWFETYVHKCGKVVENQFNCSCSQDLELCLREGVSKDELLKRLDFCVRFGMCPHVFLVKRGIRVTYDQLISVDDTLSNVDLRETGNPVRHLSKSTAGIYWIQLAIVFGKDKLLTNVLQLCRHNGLKMDIMFSIKHRVSTVMLAVACRETVIAGQITMQNPKLVWHGPTGLIEDTQEASLYYYYDACCLALHLNQLEDFRVILSYSFEGIDMDRYVVLFQIIYTLGCYRAYNMIFEETDFQKRFFLTESSFINTILDSIMIRAVFTCDPSIVQLFIDNGFNINASLDKCSALVWAEHLHCMDVVNILYKMGATRQYPRANHSLVFLLIEDYVAVTLDILPIIHRLCTYGLSVTGDNSSLTAAWTRHQNNVVKYLLLRGAEPACLAGQWTYAMNDWRRLVYHLIKANTFVPLFKMLEFHIKMGPFYSNVQLIDLEIINSISVPQISASTQTYILENLSKSFLMDPVTLWCSRPRSLVSICRRALRLFYRGSLYLRFLRSVKNIVPKLTYSYLQLDDILQATLRHSEIQKLDAETNCVDGYFV